MTCAVGSAAQGTTRIVFGSALSTMSISDGLIARSSSGYSPVTVCRKMLSGMRMPSSSANLTAGMILPRAMPAMSGTTASTSEMPCSLKNCWIGVLMIVFLLRAFARARRRRPRTVRCENGLSMTCHSGCHCTASAKAGASRTLNASTRPSGARASTSSAPPSVCTPWA